MLREVNDEVAQGGQDEGSYRANNHILEDYHPVDKIFGVIGLVFDDFAIDWFMSPRIQITNPAGLRI
jgi:hypothetical protein